MQYKVELPGFSFETHKSRVAAYRALFDNDEGRAVLNDFLTEICYIGVKLSSRSDDLLFEKVGRQNAGYDLMKILYEREKDE